MNSAMDSATSKVACANFWSSTDILQDSPRDFGGVQFWPWVEWSVMSDLLKEGRKDTVSSSHFGTMLPESSSRPLPAQWPNHATYSLFDSKSLYCLSHAIIWCLFRTPSYPRGLRWSQFRIFVACPARIWPYLADCDFLKTVSQITRSDGEDGGTTTIGHDGSIFRRNALTVLLLLAPRTLQPHQGPCIKDVSKIFGISDPPSASPKLIYRTKFTQPRLL